MGIEWFRDLSITVMGFITTAVLIFAAIIIYRLYRKMTATLSLVQTLVKSVNDTVNTVEEVIKNTSQNINDTVTEVRDNIKLVSKGIGDTFTRIQERVRPLLPILAIIQGISEGIKSISKIFKKENNEEETVMNKDNAIGFGIGILTGAVIGGVIALLYAPKTGEETRKMIKDKTIEVVDTVKEKSNGVIDAFKEKTGEVVDAVKEATSEGNRKGQAAVKAIKS